MNYNFDEVIDRSKNLCAKYDERKKKFGTDDVLPLWIADMDFKTANPIIEAMEKRVKEGIWGYTSRPDSYFQSVADWQKRRNGWDVDTNLMVFSLGVVQTISAVVRQFVPENGTVLIQTPVYPEFFDMTILAGRKVLENELLLDNEKCEINWDDFEEKIKKVDLFILCNPQNPTGRVWTKDELKRMGDLCIKNNVLILSDEIHSDLIFHNKKHIPMALVSKEINDITITGISATKTFNLAGLQASTAIFPNEHMKNVFSQFWTNMDIHRNNAFSVIATEVAYREGEEWLTQVLKYISDNFDYVADFINKNIPKIKTYAPDATYLMWLDCRELNLDYEKLNEFFIRKAKLGLNNGKSYGENFDKYMRLNVACPRSILEKAMKQLKEAFDSL